MALIPTQLVSPIRAALISQGFPANTINEDGSIEPMGLVAGAFDTLEIRSKVLPPIKISLVPTKETSAVPALVQPALIFSGRAGKAALAPYGIPDAVMGWIVPVAFVAGLVGIGYLLGKR